MGSCGCQLDYHIRQCGVRNFYEFVTNLMDQLRDEPLNVAVLGQRRHDKQVFLQAICRNLAFNRGGLGRANSQGRGSHHNLQVPGNNSFNNSRVNSISSSFADVSSILQTNLVIDEERGDDDGQLDKPHILLPASPRSDYESGSYSGQTPPSTADCSGLSVEQDEGVFVNGDVEGPDAEVAHLMALQPAYTKDNLSDTLTYRYPEFPEIKFWDIPDFDAEGYSHETYEDVIRQGFDFDAFLVTSGNRFLHKDDLFWAGLLQEEKNAVFVCTHLDREIKREKTARSPSQTQIQAETQTQPRSPVQENTAVSEHATFKKVHSYYRKKFFKHSMFGLPLFIVSPSEGMKFDFPDLTRLLLRWRERKQRARKNKLLAAARQAVAAKHNRLWSIHRLVSILCGMAAGLPATPIVALGGDALLWLSTFLSRRSYGLDAATDLEDCEVRGEHCRDAHWLTASSLITLVPCATTWCLWQAASKVIGWTTRDMLSPRVVTTSLSLVAVGAACLWSQATVAKQLVDYRAQCEMIVDHTMNRKLVAYLKQTGDIDSRTASGTRSASPVSFSV